MGFVSGWYTFTWNAIKFFFKEMPSLKLTFGWNEVPVAGVEGARFECIYTGYTTTFSLDLYDSYATGDVPQAVNNFDILKKSIGIVDTGSTPAVYGDLASQAGVAPQVEGAMAWSMTIKTGRGGSTSYTNSTFGKSLPTNIGHVFSNQNGHHATVDFVCIGSI